MEEADVVIVGAGVAGLATAVALKRLGVRALVLEKAEGLRTTGSALGLSPNAWFALDALGKAHKLTTAYAPCRKGYVTDIQTGAIQEISFAKFETGGHFVRLVHRKLYWKLWQKNCQLAPFVSLPSSSPSETRHKKAHAVLSFIWMMELVYTAKESVTYSSGIFIVIPGEDIAHDPELIKREVTDNFAKEFPRLYLKVVQHSDLSSITWSRLMFRLPWDIIFGNLSNGNVTVAGDAMHPMRPDMGQGGCSALEDAVVLGRHIGESIIRNGRLVAGDQMADALKRYAEERRWRAAGLITGSYLSGWVQQEGSGWFTKFLRDVLFYRLLYSVIFGARRFDCGKLPCVSSNNPELENNQSKIE
ncbi:3-hydroxybenzoate 6-hydroxylase 1 [Morella rubra]|uniref:3-hydroxybenzoate 6-hydroxylase 1 n=1 Tax=Morella rubra TaxID=262757 RepID=A0A6A1VDF7_9ROSI|nr:3-hydroxybenzoate 6-hydroxylase 1 [Morella rubra]